MSMVLDAPPPAAAATDVPPRAADAATDWRAGLTGDFAPLATEKSLESFQGRDWSEVGPQLAKAFVETKRLVGTRTLTPPAADAPPEAQAAWRKTLGIPDAAEGYQLKRPEIALTVGWDEERERGFKTLAHQIGLTPAQAQALVDFEGGFVTEDRRALLRHREAALGTLRQEWGAAFPAHVGRANRALQQYGGDALVDLLAHPQPMPLGDHPVLVRAFARIAEDLIESGALEATGGESLSGDEIAAKQRSLYEEMQKHPVGSDRARAIGDQIVALQATAMRRRR